ncbi:MAG: ABC transporter ATP-binding protein [Alphaproteobacteria bacterium]
MSALLEIRGVSVRFGGVLAVDDVSFEAKQGELLGLIGPNGAGKTTIMRAITGVVRPQSGSILLAGRNMTGLATHRRVRLGLGLSQQLVSPFATMTAAQNVALAAGYRRTASPLAALMQTGRGAELARAHELLELVGVGGIAGQLPGNLPLGDLKRIEVARALALDPKLLLLDEPLAGLNQIEAAALADTIAGLNGDGLTVVLIEHNLGEVMRICSRLVVVDNGRKLSEGPPRAVMDEPAVRAAYLGEEVDDAAA